MSDAGVPARAVSERTVSAPAGSVSQNVVVLTLTYGDRAHLFVEMARAVIDQGVRRVLVFGNGLEAAPRARLEAACADLSADGDARIDIVHADENLGSAVGYGRLIEAALADAAADAVWFLDDDNVPQAGCLAALCAAQAGTGGAVTALRKDRAYMLQAVARGYMEPPARGEVFGKDIRKIVRRAVRKAGSIIGRRTDSKGASAVTRPQAPVPMPRVPYGGLLVLVGQLRRVPRPPEAFVLYADDYAFSAELAASGGLHAVPGAFIEDIEASWNASGIASRPTSQMQQLTTSKPDFRLFYAVRNAVYLDWHRVTALSQPWFWLNMAIFVGQVGISALRRGRKDNLVCICRAIGAALGNRLGRDARYPLP